MSVNRVQKESFVLPSADKVGSFRCGVCWSLACNVQVAVEEHRVLVRLICPKCGNTAEWEVNNGR